MTTITYINRLKRIDFFIRTKTTGTPTELASKLGLSERSIYDYMNDLRELGAPVIWSCHERSYIYKEPGNLSIGFSSHHCDKT